MDHGKNNVICFPSNFRHSTGRMHINYIMPRLENSYLVSEVKEVDSLECTRNHGFQMTVNGIKCILYVRDRPPLKMKYFVNDDEDEWVKNFYRDDVKFIFIYQYNIANKEDYDEIERTQGVTILPWTYSPSGADYPVENFQWENKDHKWLANSAFNFDKKRPYRLLWKKDLYERDDIYTGESVDIGVYLDMLKDTKWGLTLRGTMNNQEKFEHLQDGKCHREIEYMSFGMPLAYTYIPTYPFPFFPDEHYVLLRQPSEVHDLKDIDPAPFAQKSSETWEKYFSCNGVVQLLLDMIYDPDYRASIYENWEHLVYAKLKNQYKMGALGDLSSLSELADERTEGTKNKKRKEAKKKEEENEVR